MEKRFLLSWITSECCNIINGHTKVTAFIESHFADPTFATIYEATMTARETLQGAFFQMFG
jgi:hypothetical protein